MLQGIAAIETPFALASRYAGRPVSRLLYFVSLLAGFTLLFMGGMIMVWVENQELDTANRARHLGRCASYARGHGRDPVQRIRPQSGSSGSSSIRAGEDVPTAPRAGFGALSVAISNSNSRSDPGNRWRAL